MSMRTTFVFLAISIAIVISSSALADEGGTEINDAAALVGIDPMDTPGYPIEIYNPGRYRLSGDLSPPAGTHAIVLMGSDVTVDLMGHQIQGSAGTSGAGIYSYAGPALENVTIRNGVVREMGDAGIDLQDARQVNLQGLRITMNAGPGFRLGERAVVKDVEVIENSGCGGEVGLSSRVSRSRFHGNHECGLRAGRTSQLDALVVNDNQTIGIEFDGGGSAHNLQVSRNSYEGIWLTDMSGGGPGPPSRASFELTDLMVSANGGGSGPAGLRADSVVARIRNGTFASNGVGIMASDSDLTIGSVVISESGGHGVYAMFSKLRLEEVTIHGNGAGGVQVSGPNGQLSAEGLTVRDHASGSGIEVLDVDAQLYDFSVRNNGVGIGMAGIMFSSSSSHVLSLRRGTLKDNGGPGVQCMPSGSLRVIHSGIEVLDNGGPGAVVDCVPIQITPSFCDPPGGGPGSC